MEAIVYARYSSLEQGRGSSLARQHELCGAYCQRQNWTVVDVVEDKGTSAWTGANLSNGELAALTERLEREGGTGKVIVVEQLDRITRRPAPEVMGWLQKLTATGAQLATVNDNLVIDAYRFSRDPMIILSTVFKSFQGFEESQKKSERVGDAWARKRASDAPLTRRTVGWVKLEGGELQLIEDRAAIVREIFHLAGEGIGAGGIATRLNQRAVKPFGKSQGWQISYVKKILSNRAVIGEYQPHTSPKGGQRRAVGEVRPDYYPRVVSDELFARVQGRSQHIPRASARKMNNLLSGLAKCDDCGGAMTRIYKGKNWEYLRCERSRRAMCVNTRNYPMGVTVNRILDKLLHRAMDPTSFQDASQTRNFAEIAATAKRNADDLAKRRARIRELWEASGDAADKDRLVMLTAQLGEALRQLDEAQSMLDRARAAMPPAEHLKRVSEVRAMLDSDDDAERDQARVKVKQALDAIIETAVFSAGGYFLELRGGSGFLLFHEDGSASERQYLAQPVEGGTLLRERRVDEPLGENWAKADPAVRAYLERSDRAA